MVMRELIDREQVITEIKYMDNNGFITRSVNHVCEDIRMIPVITEQDIVKLYLEKILTEVEKIPTLTPNTDGISMYGYKIKHPQEIKNEVIRLINNLLSEQED